MITRACGMLCFFGAILHCLATSCAPAEYPDAQEPKHEVQHPVCLDSDAYQVWARAIDFEIEDTSPFFTGRWTAALYFETTLKVQCDESEGLPALLGSPLARSMDGNLSGLRSDTLRSFLEQNRTQALLDGSRLQTKSRIRPAQAAERTAHLQPTATAESAGALGVFAVSSVGFSEDRSQALVLVTSWRARAHNLWQKLMLFERSPTGWGISGVHWRPRVAVSSGL